MSVSVNQGGSITFWQMEQINSEPVRSCRVCERMRRIQLCTVHAAVQSLYSFFSFHKLICKSMYKITALSSWSMLLTNYLISQVAPTAACCHVKTKQPHLFPSTHADCTLSSWIMLFSSLPDTVTEQRGNVDRVSQLKMHMCCLHAISSYFYFIQHGETWQGDASPAPLLMHTNGKACLFSHFFFAFPLAYLGISFQSLLLQSPACSLYYQLSWLVLGLVVQLLTTSLLQLWRELERT